MPANIGPEPALPVRRYDVRRDQAVWERERFIVEVPASAPDDEILEYIDEALEDDPDKWRSSANEILDIVEGRDSEITFVLIP